MSRNVLIGIASVVGVFLIGLFVYRNNYNTAVALKKTVEDETWGNVQAAYQRRADLVPQLVATVKGAAKNEQEILTKVTNARAGIVNAKTPEEFSRLLKKRRYYGFGAYGTPEAEKEISQYAGGLKVLMLRAQIVEFVGKNKKGRGLGILLLGLGIYLYTKKK
jgi:hypothetical protein